MICPWCDGEGRVAIVEEPVDPDRPPTMECCLACQGEGQVPTPLPDPEHAVVTLAIELEGLEMDLARLGQVAKVAAQAAGVRQVWATGATAVGGRWGLKLLNTAARKAVQEGGGPAPEGEPDPE